MILHAPELYQYLLVIEPEHSITSSVQRIKFKFEKEYGCENCARLLPHITIAEFLLPLWHEHQVTTEFYNFFKRKSTFQVHLDGFDGFEPHTVFVRVTNEYPIVQIVEMMREKFKRILSPIAKQRAYFSANPHLTIARKMTEMQYYSSMTTWKNQRFKEALDVNNVILLRREISYSMEVKSSYKKIAKFELGRDAEGYIKQLMLKF